MIAHEGRRWHVADDTSGGSENDAFCAACFAPFVGISEIFGCSQRVRDQYITEAPKVAGGSRFMGANCWKIDNRWKIQGAKMAFPGRPPLSRLRRRFAPLRGSAAPLRGASRRPSGALRAPRAARAALLQTRKKINASPVHRTPDGALALHTVCGYHHRTAYGYS